MSLPTSLSTFEVCLFAQNCLAQAYLEQLLRTDPRIADLSLNLCVERPRANGDRRIFVIDQCGLEIPLRYCLRQLRDQSPRARFLVLDAHKSKEDIVRIFTMGAHGFVAHADARRTLTRAVLCIAANQLWVPHEVLPEFVSAIATVRKDLQPKQFTTPR